MSLLSRIKETRDVNENKESNIDNSEKRKNQILDTPEKKSDYDDGLDAKLDAGKQEGGTSAKNTFKESLKVDAGDSQNKIAEKLRNGEYKNTEHFDSSDGDERERVIER